MQKTEKIIESRADFPALLSVINFTQDEFRGRTIKLIVFFLLFSLQRETSPVEADEASTDIFIKAANPINNPYPTPARL